MDDLLRVFETQRGASPDMVDDELGEAVATPDPRRFGAIGKGVHILPLQFLPLLDRRDLHVEVVALGHDTHDPEHTPAEQMLDRDKAPKLIGAIITGNDRSNGLAPKRWPIWVRR